MPGVEHTRKGWHASITKPDGSIENIGTFPTRDAARTHYIQRQADLYPLPPPPLPGTLVHELRASGLVAHRRKK